MDANGLDPIDAGISDIDPMEEEGLDDLMGTQVDDTMPRYDVSQTDIYKYSPEPTLAAIETPKPVGEGLRPSTIPEGAEIIDLDSYECKNSFVHSSGLLPRIKVEEGVSRNVDIGTRGQCTSPGRIGSIGINAGGSSDVIMLDDDDEILEVKKEPIGHQPTQNVLFDWKEMPNRVEISDDDDEVAMIKEIIGQSPTSIFGPHTNGISPTGAPRNSESPGSASANSISPKYASRNNLLPAGVHGSDMVVDLDPKVQSTDILGAQRVFLRKPKPKPKDVHIAKLEQIQKKLAERITGKPVVSGAGGIFRQRQVINADAPLLKGNRKDDGDIPDENDHAWMEEVSSDWDDDGATYVLLFAVGPPVSQTDVQSSFRAAKTEYRKRVRNGIATLDDEVAFMKAENHEASRQKRVKMAEERAQLEDDEELSLFIPEDAPPQSSSKRTHATMDSDDEDLGIDVREEEADFARHQELKGQTMSKRGRQPGATNKRRGKNKLTAKDVDASMQEGMLIGNERDRKKAAAAERAAKAAAKSETAKTKKRKNKDGESRGAKTKEGKSKAKNGKKAAKQTGKRSSGPVMNNLDSLISNVIAEAQANEGEGDQPTFTNTCKANALKELMASIPGESRKSASVDKQALLKATKKFRGHGAMKADGNGCWKLKGMKSSLRHYQLLGAAFMRDREVGNEEPFGGICADEMGFGRLLPLTNHRRSEMIS